jgi:hypothetical protein
VVLRACVRSCFDHRPSPTSALKPELRASDQPVIIPDPVPNDTIQLTVFRPQTFSHLRQLAGVDEAEIQQDWQGDGRKSLDPTAGRSGAKFLRSDSQRFLLKTVPKNELQMATKMLSEYHKYLTANPDSLLTRILATFHIKHGANSVYALILLNVMDPEYTTPPSGVAPILYDLKGRVCKRGKWLENEGQWDIVHKDKDLNHHFELERDQLAKLRRQLDADTDFLCFQNLMDYSLFIAIIPQPDKEVPSNTTRPSSFFQTRYNGLLVNDGAPKIFYLGIIDMLTAYTYKKKVANTCKHLLWTNPELSTVPSQYYRERFLAYTSIIFLEIGEVPRTAPYLVKLKDGHPQPLPEQAPKLYFNPAASSPNLPTYKHNAAPASFATVYPGSPGVPIVYPVYRPDPDVQHRGPNPRYRPPEPLYAPSFWSPSPPPQRHASATHPSPPPLFIVQYEPAAPLQPSLSPPVYIPPFLPPLLLTPAPQFAPYTYPDIQHFPSSPILSYSLSPAFPVHPLAISRSPF